MASRRSSLLRRDHVGHKWRRHHGAVSEATACMLGDSDIIGFMNIPAVGQCHSDFAVWTAVSNKTRPSGCLFRRCANSGC